MTPSSMLPPRVSAPPTTTTRPIARPDRVSTVGSMIIE